MAYIGSLIPHNKEMTMRTPSTLSSLLALLLAASSTAWAQDTASPAKEQVQQQKTKTVRQRDQIYGSQLMTRQERIAHRAKLRAAKTEQEREQIREEHHKQMQERAKERGVTLPDMPSPRAKGAGPGSGPRDGSGPGPGGPGGGPGGPGGGPGGGR
jgi:hypothetical protein